MFNTRERFGIVSICLHWLMAVVIIGLFSLGWYMVDLTYYDKLYKTLPFIHKSIGILLVLVFLFRLFWKIINPQPRPLPSLSKFEIASAKIVHLVLYLVIAVVVISGYLISTADNSSISVFDLFEVPATVTSIPEQEDIAGLVHEYAAYSLIGLAVLHAGAALKHHFIDRDNTLRRMLGIRLT